MAEIRFTKMHGAGNDYVYVSTFDQTLDTDLAALAREVSDRHFGIGGDGMILIHPSEVADARMQMFNADGSEGEMCGNGVRCVAKYVYDHGISKNKTLKIETGAGVLSLDVGTDLEDVVRQVRVNMGRPILDGAKIPTTFDGEPVVNVPLDGDGRELKVTCVSMGNPHCVTFVDELSDDWVLGVGPSVENDAHFPNRINAEFVEVVSPTEVKMRVWERGSGETLACGTGACAVCVAGVLSGRTERTITVHLLGGDLTISWPEDDGPVFMTGPATEVFGGTYCIND